MERIGTVILVLLMTLGLLGARWASTAGAGISQPEDEPVSIREGSARPGLLVEAVAIRYFMGGGLHDGK